MGAVVPLRSWNWNKSKAAIFTLWKPNCFLTFRSNVCIGDDGGCCDLWCSVIRLVGCSRLLRIRRTFGRPWKSRSQSLTYYGFFEETLGCLYAGLPPLPSVTLLICLLNSGRRNRVTYPSVIWLLRYYCLPLRHKQPTLVTYLLTLKLIRPTRYSYYMIWGGKTNKTHDRDILRCFQRSRPAYGVCTVHIFMSF